MLLENKFQFIENFSFNHAIWAELHLQVIAGHLQIYYDNYSLKKIVLSLVLYHFNKLMIALRNWGQTFWEVIHTLIIFNEQKYNIPINCKNNFPFFFQILWWLYSSKQIILVVCITFVCGLQSKYSCSFEVLFYDYFCLNTNWSEWKATQTFGSCWFRWLFLPLNFFYLGLIILHFIYRV